MRCTAQNIFTSVLRHLLSIFGTAMARNAGVSCRGSVPLIKAFGHLLLVNLQLDLLVFHMPLPESLSKHSLSAIAAGSPEKD